MDNNLLNLFLDQPKDIRRDILIIYYTTYYSTHWPCGAKNDQKFVFIDENDKNNENIEIDHIKIRFNYICSNCKSKHILSANMFKNYIDQFYKEISNIVITYNHTKFIDELNLFIEYVKYMNYKKLFNKDNYIKYLKKFILNWRWTDNSNLHNISIEQMTQLCKDIVNNQSNQHDAYIYKRNNNHISSINSSHREYLLFNQNDKVVSVISFYEYLKLFENIFLEEN
jgi:hypothetical protein